MRLGLCAGSSYLAIAVGRLNLTFDDNGNVLVSSGQPLLLDYSVPQDEDVLKVLEIYRPAIDEQTNMVIGTSLVTLDGSICRTHECNLGNLIADANVLYKASFTSVTWTEAPIGLMNGGGIRITINPGVDRSVTRSDILGALPFVKQIVSLKLTGADLVKTLELGIRGNGETSRGEFLQVSGIRVVYDMSKPAMSRVVSVKVRCGSCSIPTYQDINLTKNYTILTTDFLADGMDGLYVLKEKGMDRQYEGVEDVDVLVWYFEHFSPAFAEIQGRISFVEYTKTNSGMSLTTFGFSKFILITAFFHLSLL